MLSMKTFLLIACSICSVIAYPGEVTENILEKAIKIVFDDIEAIKDLYWYDDNGNLVPVDVNEQFPETLEQTEKQLPNRVSFYLYTRKNPQDPQKLYIDDEETLKNSNFDVQKETKIVTHGWLNNYQSPACTLVRDAFLKHSNCNVIVIDWGSITFAPYIWASDRVLIVGKFAAKMISFLESKGLDEKNLTVVGHSLGAHVAGLASYYATRRANYVVQLEPARSNFQKFQFAPGQGKFVEVIHTNAAIWGMDKAVGDADFWPNGGYKQPGCVLDILADVCSHLRSYEYFAESINSKTGFVGVQCPSGVDYEKNNCKDNPTGIMGGAAPQPGLKGNYFLTTNTVKPYAKGSQS